MQQSEVLAEQIKTVIKVLETKGPFSLENEKSREFFNRAITWLERFPNNVDYSLKNILISTICKAFSITELELIKHTDKNIIFYEASSEDSDMLLESVLPRGGWFSNYAEFTRYNEAPMSYHIFSSLTILGAALGRKVWKSMGGAVKPIYPNYCVILIGPTGRVKKTTAADIASDFIRDKSLCPVIADKITPESLVSALVGDGHQFLYAPEAAVFFGKQKYNDGLSTLLLRLLDCPERFEAKTISRDSEIITNVALSILAGTTPSLILDAAASEVASSGFLNRFMLVVEDDSNRCFPHPSEGVGRNAILEDIERLKGMSGELRWSAHGAEAWDAWYRERWFYLRKEADELTSEVLQRSFNHVLRTCMIMHLVLHDDFEMCDKCLAHSIKLIEYTDRNVPAIMSKLRNNKTSDDLDFVVHQMMKANGAIDHSTLVRKVSRRMQAVALRTHLQTLEQAGRIKIGKRGALTYYVLLSDKKVEASVAS